MGLGVAGVIGATRFARCRSSGFRARGVTLWRCGAVALVVMAGWIVEVALYIRVADT